MGIEEIVQLILSHRSGLSREEIVRAINQKKAASGGFLTDEAAARLVAAEQGLDLKLEERLPQIYIRQLVSGLNDVTISGRVLLVNMPKMFFMPNGSGQVARLLVADKTGTIGVVLWNDKAEMARRIHLGQIVKVLHGYVRRSKHGELELHVGERGDVQIAPPDVNESDFPPIRDFCEKIANISEGRRKVNVKGVIDTMYPMSTFQRSDGTQGKVSRMVIEDDTGCISAVFWDEKAEEAAKGGEGAVVLLMNAKVKKSRSGALELHVDDSANIEFSNCLEGVVSVKDLRVGMRVACVEGRVASKPMVRIVTVRGGERVSVASFELEDDSGRVWVSAWRKHAEEVEGLAVDTRVRLKDVYVRRGFGDQLEINTRASTEIEAAQ